MNALRKLLEAFSVSNTPIVCLLEQRRLKSCVKELFKFFSRFDEYGIKVSYDNVKLVSESIQFLGCEESTSQWIHENSLRKMLAELVRVENIKDLERVIGVISYTRRCVKFVEMILGPLREGLKTLKSGHVSESWIEALNGKIKDALKKAITKMYIG